MSLTTINFKKLTFERGERLLDMGCGLGRHCLTAYRDLPIGVVGVDLSLEDLCSTSKRKSEIENYPCSGSLSLCQANGYRLPFKSSSFDHVICSEVLEHVEDVSSMIDELIRVLVPGGTFTVSVPKFLPEKISWMLSEDYAPFAGHVRIFKGEELPDLLKTRGLLFQDYDSAHAVHSPYWWLRSIFFRFGEDFLVSRVYQRFMNWHQFKGPKIFRDIERFFDPVFGKSVIYYLKKPI